MHPPGDGANGFFVGTAAGAGRRLVNVKYKLL